MTQVIVFDVNETLLDVTALDAPFEELFGSAALRGKWFAQMLQLSFVSGLTGDYIDFTTAQRAALHMIADRAGREIAERAADEMVTATRASTANVAQPRRRCKSEACARALRGAHRREAGDHPVTPGRRESGGLVGTIAKGKGQS